MIRGSHIPDIDIADENLGFNFRILSSIQTDQGFRNKVLQMGWSSMFGNEAKEFEVLQLAPSGADLVVQQDGKTADSFFYRKLGGSPGAGWADDWVQWG